MGNPSGNDDNGSAAAGESAATGLEVADNRRRLRRRSILWPARLHVGRHVFPCQIWNLSLGGARLRVDLPLKEGANVVLDMPGRGRIPAIVAWTGNAQIGLAFDMPPERVRRLFEDLLGTLGLDESPDN